MSIHKYWRSLVQLYTALQLSHGTDKLPALSGLAKQISRGIQQQHGDAAHVAGLWTFKLLEDLTWYMLKTGHGKKLSVYRAPSWSWASIDGEVCWSSRQEHTDWAEITEVLNVSCEPAGEDPFGSVVGGTLTTRAQVAEARCSYKAPADTDDLRCIEYKVQRQDRFEKLDADYPLAEAGKHHVPSGHPVFCLRDGRTGPKAPLGNKALVLRRAEDAEGPFQRIGVVDLASKEFDEWFVAVGWTVVDII